MDTNIRSYGDFIEYEILPEHKRIQLVSIRTKEDFKKLLAKYSGKKLKVDYEKLKSDNDSNYLFKLSRIDVVTVYSLSNGLYVIDQYIDSKANPYYICRSLDDFKLIKKYLLIFRTEDLSVEVWCSIHEHFEIKKFLEKEKGNLEFVEKLSDDRRKVFLNKDGKCIYVKYINYDKEKFKAENPPFQEALEKHYGNKFDSEEVIYFDLVIYESMEKLKLHKVGLVDKINW